MLSNSPAEAVRPFDFSRLRKIRREEAKLVNQLYRYLPATSGETFHDSFERLVSQELGEKFTLGLSRVHSAEAHEYFKTLPQTGLFLVLGMPPLEVKAFCEIDYVLGHVMIDRLLGGSGKPPKALAPLTEIEEGVISYLGLTLLGHFYEQAGGSERSHFRLQAISSRPADLNHFVPSGDRLIIAAFDAKLGKQGGYFRLLFPQAFAEQVLFEPLLTPQEALRLYGSRREALGFVPTHLWAEAGRAAVRQSELQGIREGDIVLLDGGEVRKQEGKWGGYVTLRVGNGTQGSYRARLMEVNPQQFRAVVEGSFMEHPV